MHERNKNLVVRIDDGERKKLLALEEALDENASRLIRKWIAQHYAAQFGDAAPRVKR